MSNRLPGGANPPTAPVLLSLLAGTFLPQETLANPRPDVCTIGLTNPELLDLHLVSVCSYAGDAGKDRSVIG